MQTYEALFFISSLGNKSSPFFSSHTGIIQDNDPKNKPEMCQYSGYYLSGTSNLFLQKMCQHVTPSVPVKVNVTNEGSMHKKWKEVKGTACPQQPPCHLWQQGRQMQGNHKRWFSNKFCRHNVTHDTRKCSKWQPLKWARFPGGFGWMDECMEFRVKDQALGLLRPLTTIVSQKNKWMHENDDEKLIEKYKYH